MLSHFIMWFMTLLGVAFTTIVLWKVMIGNKQQGGYIADWKVRDDKRAVDMTNQDNIRHDEHNELMRGVDSMVDANVASSTISTISQATLLHMSVELETIKTIVTEISNTLRENDNDR